MSGTLSMMKPHLGGQRALYLHPARFQVVACGRRFGKTEFGKLIVKETLFKYGLNAWWVAPTYKMSGDIWRGFRRELEPYAGYVSGSERVMEFRNGATLTVWTGSQYDTMRGGAPGVVVVDEAGMIPNGEDMWFAAIEPALTDTFKSHNMGKALFLSTPRGRNWFWTLFQLGQDPMATDYKSWQFPSWYNPMWTREMFEAKKHTVPLQFWDQEYAAVFLDDAGAVFRNVRDVSTGEYVEKAYQGNFVMGVDWAKSNDFTVIAVWDIDKQKMVDMDRFNQIGWHIQRERVKKMYQKWQPVKALVEQNSIGDVNLEALQRDGLNVEGFMTTAQSKPVLIEDFALAIERGEVTLLNDRVLYNELQAYEMNRSPSGHWKYGAPLGVHDDTVIAAALGYYAIKHYGIRLALAPTRMKAKIDTGRSAYGRRRL